MSKTKAEIVPIDKELLKATIDLIGELPTGSIAMKIPATIVAQLQNVLSQPGQEIDLTGKKPMETAGPQNGANGARPKA